MMATERRNRRMDDFLTLLPDDLLKKILLPLPVESIVSLASTCKKWRDYLTDDDFARLHLDRWRSRYAILYHRVGKYPGLVYLPIFDGSANEIILERLKDCFSKILKKSDYNFVRVLDSCDGLLLIAYDRVWFVVCNPLMRSFKFLQFPPLWYCYWNIVYDASIKRYKIIAITRVKVPTTTSMKSGGIILRGRQVYILELCRSSSESSEWKEVFVCDDELGGGDFGGIVQKSVLVDEKGKKKKKLYYLTYKDDRFRSGELRTSLIYIDIENHQVKAVEAATCSSMSLLDRIPWVDASSTGRFYMSDLCKRHEEFNLFVLEDFHNPIWKRRCIIRRNVVDLGRMVIQPVAVVQDNGNDEGEKILYEINGKIYEYQTVGGLWIEVSNNTGHHFRHVRHGYNYCGYFSVPHLHSLIRI